MSLLYKWETIGHQRQLEQLEQEIKTGNVSHAYLFSGPKDIGMFRISQIFCNILLCPNNYCRKCETCKLIQSGSHPDIIKISDNGESIKIDDVRDLIRKTNLTSQGKYRIILIENLERMPIEAQNSFLKTLEEPPGKTLFILTSTHVNQVLSTIKSRVRRYFFLNVEKKTLEKSLKEKFGKHPHLEEIIDISQGRPGFAINLMQNNGLLLEQRTIYNQIESFLKENDLAHKLMFAEGLINKGDDQIELFFDAFSRYLRKLIFEYLEKDYHPLKSRFNLQGLVNLFESFEETRYLIKGNVNKKLALENFFLSMEK